MDINQIMTSLEAKHPGESEYLQAVKEVLLSIEDIYNQHPEFEKASLIERLVEPDRIFTFKVPWVDDKGKRHEGNANAKGRWLDDYLKGGKKRNFAPDTFAKLYKKNAGL